ncbi:MAG: hypothetical protein JW804_07970 [Sedimentisphaerales bacterium]|nr:hypothetical protein [Sedimentisphaerales bacterium]
MSIEKQYFICYKSGFGYVDLSELIGLKNRIKSVKTVFWLVEYGLARLKLCPFIVDTYGIKTYLSSNGLSGLRSRSGCFGGVGSVT